MEAVIDAKPICGMPLVLQLHRLLKVPGFGQDREVTWVKYQPGMKEHEADWSALSARTLHTEACIDMASSWVELCKAYTKMTPAMLPGYGCDVKNRIIVSAKALLSKTICWDDAPAGIQVSTVDAVCKLAESMMIIDPKDFNYANDFRRLRKFYAALGSAAVKSDVIQRAKDLSENVTGSKELAALNQSFAD